jgi:hypothetical protein
MVHRCLLAPSARGCGSSLLIIVVVIGAVDTGENLYFRRSAGLLLPTGVAGPERPYVRSNASRTP